MSECSNRELDLARDYAEHTGISIFLTGKAGTGKTTFLRDLKAQSAKTIAIVAPTGVAAINAGGVTIHSFFQLPLAPYIPGSEIHDKYNFSRDKLRVIRALDLLVIDEISMVRADLLDAIDHALRKYRRNQHPFGGVQLLMIGDLRQLAPVVKASEESMLREHYDTLYFFGSKALSRIPYVTIELNHVYRQQNERFLELLNHVRDNRLTQDDHAMLESRLNPTFQPNDADGYIRLTSHNNMADAINEAELARLRAPLFRYNAKIDGTFPDYAYPTADCLLLREGAQVMFVRNDSSSERRYYNGKIGRVVYADAGCVKVLCPGDEGPITVEPQRWDNAKYVVNDETNEVEEQVQGTFIQLPLRLAWAITIHKSQGLTFDKVIIDAGASFAPGQVYVALSRCRTLEGMVLTTPLRSARLGVDPTVSSYIMTNVDATERSVSHLPQIKEEYYRHLLSDLFNFAEIANYQSSLSRVMTQTFSHAFAEATAQQQEIGIEIRSKLIEVADRWIAVIATMPMSDLCSARFHERLTASISYFMQQLGEIFGESWAKAVKVRSDNKKATLRVRELLVDLKTAVKAKTILMQKISANGFTIPNYLIFKQQAVLEASNPRPFKAKASADKQKTAAAKRSGGYAHPRLFHLNQK